MLRRQLEEVSTDFDNLPVYVAAGMSVAPCAGVESPLIDLAPDQPKCVMIVPTPPWDWRR
jgi:hypothetical protein